MKDDKVSRTRIGLGRKGKVYYNGNSIIVRSLKAIILLQL